MTEYDRLMVDAHEAFSRLATRNDHAELEPQVWHLTTYAFSTMTHHAYIRMDYARQLAQDLSALPVELTNALALAEKAHSKAQSDFATLLLTIDASEQGIGDPEPGYVFNEAARAAESVHEAFKMQAAYEVACIEYDSE